MIHVSWMITVLASSDHELQSKPKHHCKLKKGVDSINWYGQVPLISQLPEKLKAAGFPCVNSTSVSQYLPTEHNQGYVSDLGLLRTKLRCPKVVQTRLALELKYPQI